MSIVKMKRLRLFAMATDREKLLCQLQHLGCVEIQEPTEELTDPAWASFARMDDTALADTKAKMDRLSIALELLNHYAPSKGSLFQARPQVTEAQLFDRSTRQEALAAAERISARDARITAIYSEQSKLTAQKSALAPWLELNTPLDTPSTRSVSVSFGAISGNVDRHRAEVELAAVTELAQLSWAGRDREFQYVLLLCHRSVEEEAMALLKTFGFSPVSLRGWTGTARANIDAIDAQLAALSRELDACKAAIVQEREHRQALRLTIDQLAQDIQREEVKGRILSTQATLFLEGWVPADKLGKVENLLSQYAAAWEAADPKPDEYPRVPIQLKNNPLTKPLNMVTNMYVLPTYDGVDPNPLMAPFFVFFFGLMMADMSYGILMVSGGLFMLKKLHPKGTMEHMAGLLVLCGISTFIMGALTGGFLGDFIPQIAKIIDPNTTFTSLPYLFTPLTDTLAILVGCLALGLLQIITGMIISVVRKIQSGEWADALWNEVTWWVILTGIALAVLGVGNVRGYPAVLIAGLLMLLYGGTRGARGLGKITSLIGTVYNGVTGFFSDILSYARLMALMLAGSVIAQVFNTLGSVTGNVVGFVIISLIGNTLNFALNLLGCYVHDLRLQCLEFFGRFYKEGGKPFRPLFINTKYVDIKEEQ